MIDGPSKEPPDVLNFMVRVLSGGSIAIFTLIVPIYAVSWNTRMAPTGTNVNPTLTTMKSMMSTQESNTPNTLMKSCTLFP